MNIERIAHQEGMKIKAQEIARSKTKAYNPNYVSTPIRDIMNDPVHKAKKLMDDASSALNLYRSGNVGEIDEDILESMQQSVQKQIKIYFYELNKQNAKFNFSMSSHSSQVSQPSEVPSTQDTFDLTY